METLSRDSLIVLANNAGKRGFEVAVPVATSLGERDNRDVAGEYPVSGFCGSLFGSPGNALALHRHFLLGDTDCFLNMSGVSRFYHRLSINFIAINGRHAPWMAQLVTSADGIEHGDEGALTLIAGHKFGAVNQIYHGLTCAHATYKKQRHALQAILRLYKTNTPVASRRLYYLRRVPRNASAPGYTYYDRPKGADFRVGSLGWFHSVLRECTSKHINLCGAVGALQQRKTDDHQTSKSSFETYVKDHAFIHIPKTGGTSIEHYAMKHYGAAIGLYYGMLHNIYREAEHISISAGKSAGKCSWGHVPPSWLPPNDTCSNHYFTNKPTFCFIRNPYERAVSSYRHFCVLHLRKMLEGSRRRIGLNEYLKKKLDSSELATIDDCHFIPQSEYVKSCDEIIKTSQMDLWALRFNITFWERKRVTEGHTHKNGTLSMCHVTPANLSDSVNNTITLRYAEDIRLFNLVRIGWLDVVPRRASYTNKGEGRWFPAYYNELYFAIQRHPDVTVDLVNSVSTSDPYLGVYDLYVVPLFATNEINTLPVSPFFLRTWFSATVPHCTAVGMAAHCRTAALCVFTTGHLSLICC